MYIPSPLVLAGTFGGIVEVQEASAPTDPTSLSCANEFMNKPDGVLDTPVGQIRRHKNCIVIMTDNFTTDIGYSPMNQAVKEGTLTDPFDEVLREPSVRASGKQERPDVKDASKANEKGKKSMAKPTLPVLQGIMSGDTRQAVLVEYQGKQYILYVGDSLGHIRLESIGEDKAVWQTPTGEQVMHMHQIGK